MHIEGRLGKIDRSDPPWEAAQEGVNDFFEAWVFSEYLGSNPYKVIFTEWPADLPRSLLGKELLSKEKKYPIYRVAMDGYFIKKYRYQARDGKKTDRDAPLFVGHTLTVIGEKQSTEADNVAWLGNLGFGIVAIFAFLLATVLGLTLYFRRTDSRIRRRLLATRGGEFVLPPPDALPVAAPVAPQGRSTSVRPVATPRITFPAGTVERRIEPPPGGEGDRGSPDKPPEEGAGAQPRP
jgi:hypothetical protein